MNPMPGFWKDKRVLLTGHTGFKGGWLALWLHHLGAKVTGISLPPASQPNLFELARVGEIVVNHLADIREHRSLVALVVSADPQIVFHFAAQSLVRSGYRHPLETFATNTMGTANLLDALRQVDAVRAAVIITTDKVYLNREWPFPYREDDRLGGHDPYSSSKAAAEIVTACYRRAFLAERGVAVATARAGNVIGGGDWSEDRLIPDAVRAWQAGKPLVVRRPNAVRPWQHVLEPLAGYLRLAEFLFGNPERADAYNFGPETHTAATVREVIEMAREAYGSGQVVCGDGDDGPHEAGTLALEIAKSKAVLDFIPKWTLAETVAQTMNWYLQQAKGADARTLCLQGISRYEAGP
jgi:CDP-glucose 4,6-dehydratase